MAVMYLMISTYLRPLDEVDLHRADHQAFLDTVEQAGILISAGRRVPPDGGIVLLAVDSAEQAQEVMAKDPYVLAGVAHYEPYGWAPGRGVLAGLDRRPS
jgi:uncharacterized protein YciI